jgi:hypothetical protein
MLYENKSMYIKKMMFSSIIFLIYILMQKGGCMQQKHVLCMIIWLNIWNFFPIATSEQQGNSALSGSNNCGLPENYIFVLVQAVCKKIAHNLKDSECQLPASQTYLLVNFCKNEITNLLNKESQACNNVCSQDTVRQIQQKVTSEEAILQIQQKFIEQYGDKSQHVKNK